MSLASAGTYAVACVEGGASNSSAWFDAEGGAGRVSDAAFASTDAEAPGTTMRLAHLAPDLGAVDFCYRTATSTSFAGPVLGGGLGPIRRDAAAPGGGDGADLDGATDADTSTDARASDASMPDAGATSIGFRTVSRYLTLGAAGPLTVVLVAPGSTSCATPLLEADVTLDPGKLFTVAIVGGPGADAGALSLTLVAFIDDRTTLPEKARVRMVHAALGTNAGRSLAVRASGEVTIPVGDPVEPKKVSAPSTTIPVDSLGYATLSPLPSPAQLAIGAAAGSAPPEGDASVDSWVSEPGELDLRGGSLHTGFVLSGETTPFEVLWCTDTALAGERTVCRLVR